VASNPGHTCCIRFMYSCIAILSRVRITMMKRPLREMLALARNEGKSFSFWQTLSHRPGLISGPYFGVGVFLKQAWAAWHDFEFFYNFMPKVPVLTGAAQCGPHLPHSNFCTICIRAISNTITYHCGPQHS